MCSITIHYRKIQIYPGHAPYVWVFLHSCDVRYYIWQLLLVVETCIPLTGVNFTFLYITFLYTLPVRLYHFNCLSEQDLLWIMGMINQIEIFPSSFGKENKKYSLTFFIWSPYLWMKPLYETLKVELWILGNMFMVHNHVG